MSQPIINAGRIGVLSPIRKDGGGPIVFSRPTFFHVLSDGLVPFTNAISSSKIDLSFSLEGDTDGEITSLVQQLYGLYFRQFYL